MAWEHGKGKGVAHESMPMMSPNHNAQEMKKMISSKRKDNGPMPNNLHCSAHNSSREGACV